MYVIHNNQGGPKLAQGRRVSMVVVKTMYLKKEDLYHKFPCHLVESWANSPAL